jgi:Protein of unknown function (DUF2586).
MGDVTEFLIDGVSGLTPNGAEGKCIVAGCCSRGKIGQGEVVGKRSDLAALFGVGPLVDALRDIFTAGGQEPYVVAVPVEGVAGGYITDCRHQGSGPEAQSAGLAARAADVVAVVTVAGPNGEASLKVSFDGGDTFSEAASVPESGEVAITDTGAKLIFKATEENPLVVDDSYSFRVVTPLSQHQQSGSGPSITATGQPKAGGQLQLVVVKGGELNTATYQLSLDGGDNFGPIRTLPLDAEIKVDDLGIALELTEDEYQAGAIYSWEVLSPVPTTAALMNALTIPMEEHDVEFVYVAGPSDSVDWAAAAALALEKWNSHRPVYFKFESRLPRADEDVNQWANTLISERQGFTSKYVQVVAAFGEIVDSTGLSKYRSWGGLNAGRNVANPVQRAAGAVADGTIGQVTLPDGWNENIQKALETAGFITPKRYAGVAGVYWGESRTMAEDTSDFQYEEVLRVTFKAIRLCRKAALLSLYSEAGDALLVGNAAGLKYLEAQLSTALGTMTAAVPQELASYVVEIPLGQDIVNNGLAVELTFIGIPIIKSIKLYGKYVYAGGKFDPRLED